MLQNLKKPDAIFFDWDGTLVDSLPSLMSYYNHVLERFDLPKITVDEAKKNIRRSAREVFPEIFGSNSDEAFKVYYDIVSKTHLSLLTPFLGSEKFLNDLQHLKIPLGIISNKKHEFLLKEISHLAWDKYFISNIGAGVASKDKPSGEALLLAAERIGLSPLTHHLWYVGDTETDMLAAKDAGFELIFIEHGLGTRNDCFEKGATPYFVKDLNELIDLTRNFF